MANTPITERQTFWRDHVLAAAAFDGTIFEYAKANSLIQWPLSLPIDVIDINTQQLNWLFSGDDLTLIQGHESLQHFTVL